MHDVKVDKADLLKVVSDNRTKHVSDYNEAVVDYKAAVVKVAKNNLKIANTADLEKFVEFKPIPAAPRSYENDYVRAIAMLAMSVDTEIVLEQHVFNQLVLDDWAWKEVFSASNALYKSY